jgi:hypothetical protein
MYAKLRYKALQQRAQSTTCETLAAQVVIHHLEMRTSPVYQSALQIWLAKRSDYAADTTHPAYLALDYVLRTCLVPGGGGGAEVVAAPFIEHLAVRDQCSILEIQRLCSILRARIASATAPSIATSADLPETRAAALIAAQNLGAALDIFLWKNANQQPINVF